MWEKEKLLVTNNSSFSHVLYSYISLVWQNAILCGNGLTLSKMTKFADDNFKFDENGRKLSKRVEIAIGSGEIARY